jgi:hypothetical protein
VSNEQLATALRKIAEGLYEAADTLFGVSEAPTAPRAVSAAPGPIGNEIPGPEFPPFEPTESAPYEPVPLPADTPGLGRCPSHNLAWTVKEAGVSKMGKAYNSFWKCDGKTDGVFCNKKPTRAWADAHPL